MDISFDIRNSEGDCVLVALSYYDSETIEHFSTDLLALTLVFYDVTLIRKTGTGYVGSKILYAVTDVLARFLDENDDAVLCFYCDADTDVQRNHKDLLPQEYRSRLFSRMFDKYTKSHGLTDYINHRVEIEDSGNPQNKQYAHFIYHREHEMAVRRMGQILMQK
ncbi:MAG: hypothetical protein K2H63_04535 [Paramuribaculum sp.]|nr:hypothetical protein [Paramuribaculum sp.]